MPIVNQLGAERSAFEDAAYAHYERQRAAGLVTDDGGEKLSREGLFWTTPSGEYGVRALNAAWWGWQMRYAFGVMALQAAAFPKQ